jgi:DNA (cytosine-5)-methyltransferase 1
MPRKNSHITITDQFCGAGGSSQGAKKVLDKIGGEIKLALNHWKLAIETHNTNFPDTYHECTDISACDPRRYPSTDILITSPECTTHSPAGGNNHKTLKKQMDLFETQTIDPATERSRATMWDVCRFAEYHDYNAIIVENVVEAKTRWVLFDEWLLCMHKLGYNHKCVYINSMHCHPTPQSRDRMYIVFWKKKNKAPLLGLYACRFFVRPAIKNVAALQSWKNVLKTIRKNNRQQYLFCCPSCSTVVEPYYYAAF